VALQQKQIRKNQNKKGKNLTKKGYDGTIKS
jgi:hypothetical protein